MNYRVERVVVGLQELVAGLNPIRRVDPIALANAYTDFDAQHLGLRPLSDYYIADFGEGAEPYVERRRWYKASAGLKTVKGLLQHYRDILIRGKDPLGREPGVIQKKVHILEQLQSVLQDVETAGVGFCLLVTD
jgi:hypothetical protein